jgi:hypothetical protein
MPKRNVYVRTSPADTVPPSLSDALVVSDLAEGSTLSHDIHRITDVVGEPLPAARDLFTFAGAVYVADKKTPRKSTADAWTRDFEVRMPVADVERWESARPALERSLSFLTGDTWSLRFRRGIRRPVRARKAGASYNAVHLFSGGLDSLIGAIDALAGDERLLLLGHHDSGLTEPPQKILSSALDDEYENLSTFVPVRARGKTSGLSAFPLPAGSENTTRSRSLVFIAMGLVGASALGANVTLRIPENGLIALNVPLVPERSGSCSTRTTHPHFLAQLRQALDVLGIRNELDNPYLLLTKGEMLEHCRNPELIRKIGYASVSCSRSEQARWDGKKNFPKNCGYCYPCIIRRAAFHAINEDRFRERTGLERYRIDVCKKPDFVHEPVTGRDLRAVLAAVGAGPKRLNPLLSGPVPADVTMEQLSHLHARGIQELRDFFEQKGSRGVKSYAGIA